MVSWDSSPDWPRPHHSDLCEVVLGTLPGLSAGYSCGEPPCSPSSSPFNIFLLHLSQSSHPCPPFLHSKYQRWSPSLFRDAEVTGPHHRSHGQWKGFPWEVPRTSPSGRSQSLLTKAMTRPGREERVGRRGVLPSTRHFCSENKACLFLSEDELAWKAREGNLPSVVDVPTDTEPGLRCHHTEGPCLLPTTCCDLPQPAPSSPPDCLSVPPKQKGSVHAALRRAVSPQPPDQCLPWKTPFLLTINVIYFHSDLKPTIFPPQGMVRSSLFYWLCSDF